VKAVNLIPHDQRRGAGGIAGRSGGIVYVLVGGLTVIVGLGVLYAFAVKSVADRTGQLAYATEQVNSVNAEAVAYQPFEAVEHLRQGAVSGVVSLATQRFDWPDAMEQIALALPTDVTLTALNGAGASASGGASTSTTATTGGPQFTLQGCASTQAEVATLITRLQQVPHVNSVALSTSGKATSGYTPNSGPQLGPTADEAHQGTCPHVSYDITLGYDGAYNLPDQKLPTGATGSTQTVSTGSTSTAVAVTATAK
jgi:Tfp pilus assembly protein PilN